MTHYGPEPLPDRDPTPPDEEPPTLFERYTPEEWAVLPDSYKRLLCYQEMAECTNRADGIECRCPDCSEAEWTRLQEAQAESPSEWNQAYKEPIDKREMRRRE